MVRPTRLRPTPARVLALLALVPGGGLVACSSGGTASSASPASDAGTDGDGGPLGGRAEVTLSRVGAYDLQVDSSRAYATTVGSSPSVVQIPLSGGKPTVLWSGSAQGLAVGAGAVYWTSGIEVDAGVTRGLVLSAPIGGGTTTTVATGGALAGAIVTDATSAYWLDSGPCASAACGGTVLKAPLGGGDPVVVATTLGSPLSITLDGESVYWGTGDGRVMKAPKAGGAPPTQLAFYQTSAGALRVEGGSVYWSTGAGDLMKTPVAGGASTAIVTSSDSITAMTTDATDAYFATTSTTGSGGRVEKVALAGGTPATIWASAGDTAYAIQVDATRVYLATYYGGVLAISPK